MTTFTHLPTRDGPGRFEPGERFGAAFAHSGLAASGSVADLALRDESNIVAAVSNLVEDAEWYHDTEGLSSIHRAGRLDMQHRSAP